MSMLDVAKYLYFSNSIDLSQEEERFFNVANANSGRLFSRLHVDRCRRAESPACTRRPVIEDRLPLFGKGK
jgi:hypothetical protein